MMRESGKEFFTVLYNKEDPAYKSMVQIVYSISIIFSTFFLGLYYWIRKYLK